MTSSCILISTLDHILSIISIYFYSNLLSSTTKVSVFSLYYGHFRPIYYNHQNKPKTDMYHCMYIHTYVPRDILIPLESELSVHVLCERSWTNTITHYFACSSPSTLMDNLHPLHHTARQLQSTVSTKGCYILCSHKENDKETQETRQMKQGG